MRNRKGMSLVELLIVVLILGALAAIAIPRVASSSSGAKEKACATNVDLINSAIEMSAVDTNGIYPKDDATFSSLIYGTTKEPSKYFPDGQPVCPLDGKYVYDATTKRVKCTHTVN